MRRWLSWTCVVALVVAVGCASTDTKEMKQYKTLATSAAAVDSLGAQFQGVSALYVQRCDVAKTLDAKTCNSYRAFGEKFKAVYPGAVGLWKSSRRVSDVALQGQTETIIASLIGELVSFGTTVGYPVVKNLSQ